VGCIRDLSAGELRLFADVISRLERVEAQCDARALVFPDLIKLLRADFGASYVFDRQHRRFERGLVYNMDPANIARYDDWYQFHDPVTFELRTHRRAMLVEEVTPYKKLSRTEFYNDFLRRDGLRYGINIFLFEGPRDLGDFRIWRHSAGADFSQRDVAVLDVLAPFIQRALSRQSSRIDGLSDREREVSALVAKGCRDREIGAILGISFSTVRTHINRAMEKKGCANRAELAAAVSSSRMPPAG
jgi:DNA-binding CsgD family transcriptional regulator